MGTYYRRPNSVLSVATTRLVAIQATTASQIFLSSGYSCMNVMNDGPNNVSFGADSVVSGSGNVIFPYAQYVFENLSNDFTVYFIADSAATTIAITEFKQ